MSKKSKKAKKEKKNLEKKTKVIKRQHFDLRNKYNLGRK